MSMSRSANTPSKKLDKSSQKRPSPTVVESLEQRVLLSVATNNVVHSPSFTNTFALIIPQALTSTTTVVTSSGSSVAYGTSVTLTATVNGTAGQAPTGNAASYSIITWAIASALHAHEIR